MENIYQLSNNQYLHSNFSEKPYPVLKGMFRRCITQQNLSNEHDEILDLTATLLIKTHNDNSILPNIVDTIFFRNRKGIFTHNLIWAFFEARNPFSLMLIASYLGSEDVNDVKLACKLLNFVPSIDMMTIQRDRKNQYLDFFYWLRENYPFLYFTGESFQRTSNPIPYIVVLDAKYLCKGISLYTGKPFIPLTEKETNIIGSFNNLDEYNKQLLSRFSLKIHSENIYLWKAWINSSISEQILIAKVN